MKLHLPKLLLTAVLAAVCYTPAWGGWTSDKNCGADGSKYIYYYDENNATGTIETLTLPTEENGLFTNSNNMSMADDLYSKLYICSGYGGEDKPADYVGQTTTITTVEATDGVQLTVTNNPWQDWKKYALLTMETLSFGDESASGSLVIANAADKVKVNNVVGTLSSVSTAGSFVVGNEATWNKISSVTVQTGGVLDLTYHTPADAASSKTHITNLNSSSTITTEAGGFIKVKVGSDANTQEVTTNLTFDKNFWFDNEVTFHGGGNSQNVFTVGDGISLKATSGMKVVSQGTFNVTSGGSLEATQVVLGHMTVPSGGHYGKLVSAGGTLKLGSVIFYNNQNGNALTVNGGSLEFTSADAISYGGASPSSNSVSISIANVSLKAATCDWTLNGNTASWATISDVSIDEINTYSIALKNVTITGNIVNNAELTLGTGVTIAAETEASISGNDICFSDTITNAGTLKLSTDSVSVSMETLSGLESEGGSSFFSIDGTTANADGSENGFRIQEGGRFYISTGGSYEIAEGLKVTVAGETQYDLTSDDKGLGFTTSGTVRSNEYYVTSGEVTVIGTGADNATGADLYILQGGTMQLTGGTVKTSEIEYTSGSVNIAAESAILQIDSADNAGSYITTTTGSAGTIDLTASAIVDNGGKTQFGGAMKVSTGGVLMLGSSNFADGPTEDWTVDVSSLDNIELAGGELKFRGGSSNLGDITVTAASTLHLYDAKQYEVGEEGNSLVTIDTLDLGANLALSTTWKSNVSIGLLTGSNANAVMTVGDCRDNKRMLTANIAHDFAGTINVNGGDAVLSNLNVKAADNTTNVVTLTGMKATGEGHNDNYLKVSYSEIDKTVTVARKRSADGQGTVISSVGLTDGSTLKFHGDNDQIVTTIEELNVAGSATVLANWNEGNIAITGLTGTDATLNLKSITPTSRNTLFSLNDSETKPSNFSGTINVSTATNNGARRTVFNLNSAEAAKNAVISLENTSTEGNGDTLALAIGADSVTVAGVKDGDNNNSSKGALMIVSGTQGIGTSAFASDSTARTLVVNTAGKDYTSSAKVSSSINLEKSGSGTQNFSGDMSAFNGTVEVSGGTLGFTKADGAVTVSSLTLSGGTLNVTGSLTLDALSIDLTKYTAGLDTTYTLVEAGSLALGSGVRLENLGGNVGEYTAKVEQSGNSITLSFSDIEAPDTNNITTTVSSFGGIADDGMLTLNVDAGLADVTKVLISGISDSIMAEILGNDKLPEGGMVGITLVGTDNKTFVASAEQVVGFQGNEGIYYGQNVENVGWVYQAAYIPEPTTATLSLLALAGLAARRRRKA